MERVKLLLIGGTSHVGKSTMGKRLADELAWNYLSTDQLARHPGRPWGGGDRNVPDDVVEYYSSLSVPELVDSVLQHYRDNVWPIVHAIVMSRLNNPYDHGLVLEGSAILPEQVCLGGYARLGAIWLTATEALISERIEHGSAYASRTAAERKLIEAFRARAVAIDRFLRDAVESKGLALLDTSSPSAFERLRALTK